jgi:hypothetical protein
MGGKGLCARRDEYLCARRDDWEEREGAGDSRVQFLEHIIPLTQTPLCELLLLCNTVTHTPLVHEVTYMPLVHEAWSMRELEQRPGQCANFVTKI